MGKSGLIITAAALLASAPAWAQPASDDLLFSAAFARSPSVVSLAGIGVLPSSLPGAAAYVHAGADRRALAAPDFGRVWPTAVKLNAGRYDLELEPHAGIDTSSLARVTEAGAMVSIGQVGKSSRRLGDLGPGSGAGFGDQGRWYMFAAVSGKAVGLNMTRAQGGEWQQAGWSQEATSALVGDGQLGVGWRKGGMQAAFGYVHREIKVRNAPHGADAGLDDSMAAFTLSLKGRK